MVHCLAFSCRCSTLHVSAYMAIFKCVWCSTFIFLKESASLLLLPFLARGYAMHVFICVFLLCFFSLVFWFLCACFCLLAFFVVVCCQFYAAICYCTKKCLKLWQMTQPLARATRNIPTHLGVLTNRTSVIDSLWTCESRVLCGRLLCYRPIFLWGQTCCDSKLWSLCSHVA
jgi:hypothetical protein